MDYYPEVIQVIPTEDFTVYIYFDDGNIKLFNAKELIGKGVFEPLKDIEKFLNTCKVLKTFLYLLEVRKRLYLLILLH